MAQSMLPPRIVVTGTVGWPLRLARHVDLNQDRIGPGFTDVMGTFVFGGGGWWRHGLALGASLNFGEEGGFTEPVRAGEQWVLTPAYTGLVALTRDWMLLMHAGLPILVAGPGRSFGAEVAAGVGYRVLAGLGVFSELGATVFAGADSSLHPMLSVELGVFIDYEVLP